MRLKVTALLVSVNLFTTAPAMAMSAPTQKPDLAMRLAECHTAIGAGIFQDRLLDSLSFDEDGFNVVWNDRALDLNISPDLQEKRDFILECFDLLSEQGDPLLDPENWPLDMEEEI